MPDCEVLTWRVPTGNNARTMSPTSTGMHSSQSSPDNLGATVGVHPPIIIRGARIVTPVTKSPKARFLRGEAMGELDVIEHGDVYIERGEIIRITPRKPTVKPKPQAGATEIDAQGRVLLPGFVDCHTHACWAPATLDGSTPGSDRLDEWDMKRRGVPYLKILEKGGGIMATVRATRAASIGELVDLMLARLHAMLALGSTTIEVKGGYGLNTETELKMLRAIRQASEQFPGTLIPTALVGHAIDPDQPGFVGRVIRETLPAIAAEFPGIAVDAYCEKSSWDLEQCIALFTRARDLGFKLRVHADQFTSLGMIPTAIKMGLQSVDHLEATTKEDMLALAASESTQAVMMPACAFHMGGAYPRGRKLIEAGGGLSIATNLNPGSAPCKSLPMVAALAVRHMGLSPQEAISAITLNPAFLLGLTDRGKIELGKRADLVLLEARDERALSFEFGDNPVRTVIAGGRIITNRQ
jgi:imidazolonepropionase